MTTAATRKFCSRFSPPGAASRHRFHPNIPVMLHFLHPSIQIFRCIRENSAVSDLLLKKVSCSASIYLLAASPELCTDRPAMPAAAENLRPVLAYIQEHFADPITIEELARLPHLSKSYFFMSCFKQTFGLGAVEYLTQLRIKAACEALRSTTRVCPKSRTTMVSATFPTSTGSSETKWDVRRRCIGRNFKIRKFKRDASKYASRKSISDPIFIP